jgi:hypothetical protein
MKQLICLLIAMIPTLAAAAIENFRGTWAVTAQGKNVLVLNIKVDGDDAARISGSIARPSRVQLSPQLVFSNVQGPSHRTPLLDPQFKDDRLTFAAVSPSDLNRRDRFELALSSPSAARLQMVDAPLPALVVVRVDEGADAASDWDPEFTYRMDEHVASNPELKRIYDEDQRERAEMDKVDRKILRERDASRRESVKRMLANGEVKTAQDFARAAMMFQHGNAADDYLLAHTLTMVSLAKGNSEAVWLSSASLDRYLHAIGQPQIYGTQFRQDSGLPMSQGQFNSTLISDALRQQLGVPTLAQQEEQRRRFEEMTRGSVATP